MWRHVQGEVVFVISSVKHSFLFKLVQSISVEIDTKKRQSYNENKVERFIWSTVYTDSCQGLSSVMACSWALSTCKKSVKSLVVRNMYSGKCTEVDLKLFADEPDQSLKLN